MNEIISTAIHGVNNRHPLNQRRKTPANLARCACSCSVNVPNRRFELEDPDMGRTYFFSFDEVEECHEEIEQIDKRDRDVRNAFMPDPINPKEELI